MRIAHRVKWYPTRKEYWRRWLLVRLFEMRDRDLLTIWLDQDEGGIFYDIREVIDDSI